MSIMRAKRRLIGALLSVGLSIPIALASGSIALPEDHVPRLADIMNAIQTRHVKAWYAGKAANWDLAEFELRQLKANLLEAAILYAGIPTSNVTTMAAPLQSLEDAIAAKDVKRFSKEFAEFTTGCNGCHASMARPFIVIRVPTEQQPFGDQLFSPQGKQ
jgi:hypothetical protein